MPARQAMNAGATTERVLVSLRQFLVSRAMRPGERLDPALLAQRLAASATPIREALHLLTGEGLVESRAGGGFNLPFLDAPGLQDRYAWSGQLLALAIRTWPRSKAVTGPITAPHVAPGVTPSFQDGGQTIAERSGEVFVQIGKHSTNGEHARAIGRLNARLHHVRLVESDVLEGLEEEWASLMAVLRTGKSREILLACENYHRRRRKAAADIVRAACHTP